MNKGMIKTIIIDDEQHCIDRLQRLLHGQFADILQMAGCFQTVASGISAIQSLQPDLVFLDVQIHDQTGFDLLEQLAHTNFDVIFCTAYEQYAIQAFKCSAIDYLLKPVDSADLAQAVNKVVAKEMKRNDLNRVEVLLHNLRHIGRESKRICIPVLTGLELVQVSDIVRCESAINYTTIFMQQQPKLVVAKTLKEFEELLSGYNFCRVHNSHLVNLAYVKSYNKGKGGYLTMLDGTAIEVSTRRKEELLKRLAEW